MNMKRWIILSVFATLLSCWLTESREKNDIPMIGAQIIVEPWQSPEDVDTWFRTMSENGMTICRIRMFEQYMRTDDNSWDFTCFDTAFDSAAKYGIKVFATLFPMAHGHNTLGGFKHPANEEHMKAISGYIAAVVGHYKAHPALYGWVLMNEPGTGGRLPSGEFADEMMREWETAGRPDGTWTEGYTSDVFNRQRFLSYCNTRYIEWLSEQVRLHDSSHEIHINNHQIFSNAAEYDFPAWRGCLTSLGASAHPSWHFGYFDRERYAVAMGANCRIIASGAGDLPFWVTELQGGTNTYSGYNAFCPTAEETCQWLWTGIANGADGIIFWCYNPRTIGEEAGEWALVNNDNSNSDRLDAAKSVAGCLKENEGLFASAAPVDSHVSIIYIRESLWAEQQMQIDVSQDIAWEGRQKGGVMKSAIGMYEALMSCGINANFMEIAEYDWSREDYSGETVILANQISIPTYRMDDLRHFVECGGKLVIEGLTGFFDENLSALNNVGRPLEDLLGGILSEVKTTPGDFRMKIPEDAPVHMWKGTIANTSGTVLTKDEAGAATSTRHRFGKGETVWFPSLLALGARRSGEYGPLASWLKEECGISVPVSYDGCEPEVMMTLMETPQEYVAVLINKASAPKKIRLQGVSGKGRIIFAGKDGKVSKNKVSVSPEETLVAAWPK